MPPAGIAVIRVTGSEAGAAVIALAGRMPAQSRRAERALFRTSEGEPLDDGLLLWFPAPRSVTGEDVAEFHVHGGRAVIAAMEAALEALPGLRRAEPGEFTRRAFANGRIDLAEAEGLADLLSAETELQRRAAVTMAGGSLSKQLEVWRTKLLELSAQIEAQLDFDGEDDLEGLPKAFAKDIAELHQQVSQTLSLPSAETLREGFRVALAGPPNAGKSTLFNALTDSEAAIATPIPGTTRDVLERPVALAGIPFTFVDMAGVHEKVLDPIEEIGISRARSEILRADLVLWLGPEGEGPEAAWEIATKSDLHANDKRQPVHRVSPVTGEGMHGLIQGLVAHGRTAMPAPGEAAVNRRQRERLKIADEALESAIIERDLLIIGEFLRLARVAFDAILGRTAAEEVLDAIFARFCIGK